MRLALESRCSGVLTDWYMLNLVVNELECFVQKHDDGTEVRSFHSHQVDVEFVSGCTHNLVSIE